MVLRLPKRTTRRSSRARIPGRSFALQHSFSFIAFASLVRHGSGSRSASLVAGCCSRVPPACRCHGLHSLRSRISSSHPTQARRPRHRICPGRPPRGTSDRLWARRPRAADPPGGWSRAHRSPVPACPPPEGDRWRSMGPVGRECRRRRPAAGPPERLHPGRSCGELRSRPRREISRLGSGSLGVAGAALAAHVFLGLRAAEASPVIHRALAHAPRLVASELATRARSLTGGESNRWVRTLHSTDSGTNGPTGTSDQASNSRQPTTLMA